MTSHATYRFEIDWSDTGNFDHPKSKIPAQHVESYHLDYGSNLSPEIHNWGYAYGRNELTLFDPDGLYFTPDADGLTQDQLQTPHLWRLTINTTPDRHGRAYPVFGGVLGGTTNPVTWRLAGPNETDLAAVTTISWDTTSATTRAAQSSSPAGILRSIKEQSAADLGGDGITVTSTDNTTLFASTDWYGTWGELLQQIGLASGGLLIEKHDGTYYLQQRSDQPGTGVVFTQPPGVTPYRYNAGDLDIQRTSGVALLHNLVYTRLSYVTSTTAPLVERPAVVANIERKYGVRQLFINSVRPTTPASLDQALGLWSQPMEYARIDLADHVRDSMFEFIEGQILAMRPGGIVNVPLDTNDGRRVFTLLVCRVELSGGHNRISTRRAHCLAIASAAATASSPSLVWFREGTTSLGVTLTNPAGIRRYTLSIRYDSPTGAKVIADQTNDAEGATEVTHKFLYYDEYLGRVLYAVARMQDPYEADTYETVIRFTTFRNPSSPSLRWFSEGTTSLGVTLANPAGIRRYTLSIRYDSPTGAKVIADQTNDAEGATEVTHKFLYYDEYNGRRLYAVARMQDPYEDDVYETVTEFATFRSRNIQLANVDRANRTVQFNLKAFGGITTYIIEMRTVVAPGQTPTIIARRRNDLNQPYPTFLTPTITWPASHTDNTATCAVTVTYAGRNNLPVGSLSNLFTIITNTN